MNCSDVLWNWNQIHIDERIILLRDQVNSLKGSMWEYSDSVNDMKREIVRLEKEQIKIKRKLKLKNIDDKS